MFLKHGIAVGWKLPNIRFAGSNTACFNCAGRIIHERIEIRERICPILVAMRWQSDGPNFQHTFRPARTGIGTLSLKGKGLLVGRSRWRCAYWILLESTGRSEKLRF